MSSVTLQFATGPDRTVAYVNTRLLTGRYRKASFRAPFGTSWHHAGDGLAEPLEVSLTFHVHDATSIANAAAAVDDLIADLRAAILLDTPLGRFANGGLVSVAQTPDALGYRVDAVLIAASAPMVIPRVRARTATVTARAHTATVTAVALRFMAGVGTITTAGLTPTVTHTGHQHITASVASAAVGGLTPVILSDSAPRIRPDASSVTITALQPSVRSTYYDLIYAEQPLRWWRFSETTGTTAAHTPTPPSAGPHDLTLSGGYDLNVDGAGRTGSAIEFDGTDGAGAAATLGWSGDTDITIEAWVNLGTVTAATSTPNAAVLLWIDTEGYLAFQVRDSENTTWAVARTTAPATGQWHHILGWWYRAAKRAELYLNGVRVAQSAVQDFSDLGALTEPIVVGGATTGTGFVDGRMDEVAIYGHAFSGWKVEARYDAGRAFERVTAPRGTLTVAGLTPVVTAGGPRVVTAPAAGITVTAHAPAIITIGGVRYDSQQVTYGGTAVTYGGSA